MDVPVWAYGITTAVAVLGVAGPFTTAWLTNRHAERMKIIQMAFEHNNAMRVKQEKAYEVEFVEINKMRVIANQSLDEPVDIEDVEACLQAVNANAGALATYGKSAYMPSVKISNDFAELTRVRMEYLHSPDRPKTHTEYYRVYNDFRNDVNEFGVAVQYELWTVVPDIIDDVKIYRNKKAAQRAQDKKRADTETS